MMLRGGTPNKFFSSDMANATGLKLKQEKMCSSTQSNRPIRLGIERRAEAGRKNVVNPTIRRR